MRKILVEVNFHFENVPSFMQKLAVKEFLKHRNEVVEVFNNRIDKVNKKWDLTGKPAAFGDYVEDVNHEYVEFIKKEIQPAIDVLNRRFLICKYCLDEVGDIVGYVHWIRNSKIWFTMKKIES